MSFFAELKRRHIYRVGAGYVVVAWAIAQVVDLLSQVFALPAWIAQPALVLLAAGLPVTLAIVWIAERKPQEAIVNAVHSKNTAVDWALFAAVALLIVLSGYHQFARVTDGPLRSTPAPNDSVVSIAVLPFTNLSSDAEQEFFSDGITEEITAALAKVPDLRVVARTSAYEFKGKNENIKTMGEELGASHLIEGSVRKAANRVRITAQLIRANDGTHVWAESFERELTDVFAIQEDIARAIATNLRMPLGLAPGENLVGNRKIDADSHEKFLRAIALRLGRGGLQDEMQAAKLLEDVLAKNPDYAPGWRWLADVNFTPAGAKAIDLSLSVADARREAEEIRTKGESYARRALQLDPELAQAYTTLGVFAWSRGQLLEGEDFMLKALSLDPNDANIVLFSYGLRLAMAGRLMEGFDITEKARALEPRAPPIQQSATVNRWLNGKNDEAIALAQTLRPENRAPLLAMIYASLARYGEAADALEETASDPNSPAAKAAQLLRGAPTRRASPRDLPRLPAALEFVYLYVGAPERALDTYERRVEAGFLSALPLSFIWHPSYTPVRKTERFKALMRKGGFVAYWKAKGWPAQCHPTDGDDFVCD